MTGWWKESGAPPEKARRAGKEAPFADLTWEGSICGEPGARRCAFWRRTRREEALPRPPGGRTPRGIWSGGGSSGTATLGEEAGGSVSSSPSFSRLEGAARRSGGRFALPALPWEEERPFSLAQADVKDVLDQRDARSQAMGSPGQAQAPHYQWTFLEGRTRLRFLPGARG